MSYGPDTIRNLVVFLVPMILSLTVHEYSHALAAWYLGDDTAARRGRLTLSPLPHIDPVGTLIVPAVNVLIGGFALIGWAKPVPVNPARFRRSINMKTGMVITAMAGPFSNLLMAILSGAILAALLKFAPQVLSVSFMHGAVYLLLRAMMVLNVGLFIFNLLPLPPLDGSRLLPRSMDDLVAAISPYSFILLLVLLNIPVLYRVLFAWPVFTILHWLQLLFGLRGGAL